LVSALRRVMREGESALSSAGKSGKSDASRRDPQNSPATSNGL
jgi:hypothetical protein